MIIITSTCFKHQYCIAQCMIDAFSGRWEINKIKQNLLLLFFFYLKEEKTKLGGRKTLAATYRTHLLNQKYGIVSSEWSMLKGMRPHYYCSNASWSQQITQIWLNVKKVRFCLTFFPHNHYSWLFPSHSDTEVELNVEKTMHETWTQ